MKFYSCSLGKVDKDCDIPTFQAKVQKALTAGARLTDRKAPNLINHFVFGGKTVDPHEHAKKAAG